MEEDRDFLRQDRNYRTLPQENGEVLFVGKDVAQALGYRNTRDALNKHVDGEDKTTVAICDTGSNYKSRAVFINESDLYSLVLSSKLPQAKAFKRWVTAEVRTFMFYSLSGGARRKEYLVWTPKGVQFLNHRIQGMPDAPRSIQLNFFIETQQGEDRYENRVTITNIARWV